MAAESFCPDNGGKEAFAIVVAGSAGGTLGNLDPTCQQVRLLWKATTAGNLAQVRWGIGEQTAVTTDMSIVDGFPEAFTKGNANTLSVIGTGTLYVISGTG